MKLAETEARAVSRDRGWREWIAPAAQVLAVASALYYAVLREHYRVFYDYVRITPEDIGLTSTQILVESVIGMALLVCVSAVIAALIVGVAAAAFRLSNAEFPGRLLVLVGAAIALAFTTFITISVLRSSAHDAGACAAEGGTIRQVSLMGVPVLGVRAQQADLRWVDEATPRPHFQGRIMYLGQRDGTTVVYDVKAREPVRFPAGAAAIRLRNVNDAVCPSVTG